MSPAPRVTAFLVATFSLSWITWLGLVACARFGLIEEDVPGRFYGWGGLAPSLVALILAFREGGWSGTKRLAARVLEWRVPARWYLYALLTPLVIRLLGITLYTAEGGALRLPDINPVVIVLAFVIGLLVPLMEEYGWRGYLQPALRQRWSAASVGLIVGVAWWGWHIPLFWIDGTSLHQWGLISGFPLALGGYAVSVISLSMLFTFMYEHTGGTLLLVFLLHTATNVSADVFSSPYRNVGETGPLWWSIVVIAAAGSLAAWMLQRSSRRTQT